MRNLLNMGKILKKKKLKIKKKELKLIFDFYTFIHLLFISSLTISIKF
jgi:hypothetical protein